MIDVETVEDLAELRRLCRDALEAGLGGLMGLLVGGAALMGPPGGFFGGMLGGGVGNINHVDRTVTYGG